MSSSAAGKRSRSTARQLEVLVDRMLANKDLALARFTGPMGHAKNERLWSRVAEEISAYGSNKTHIQTKTTWRDLKKKVRSKYSLVQKLKSATSNKAPELTDLERKVLSIIGPESSVGIGEPEDCVEGKLILLPPQAEQAQVHIERCELRSMGSFNKDEHPTVADTPNDSTMELRRNKKRPFSDVLSTTPISIKHSNPPSSQTPAAKKILNVAKGQELQAETNDILKEIASTLKLYTKGKLKLLQERNDIERERNRMKMIQIKMLMQNEEELQSNSS